MGRARLRAQGRRGRPRPAGRPPRRTTRARARSGSDDRADGRHRLHDVVLPPLADGAVPAPDGRGAVDAPLLAVARRLADRPAGPHPPRRRTRLPVAAGGGARVLRVRRAHGRPAGRACSRRPRARPARARGAGRRDIPAPPARHSARRARLVVRGPGPEGCGRGSRPGGRRAGRGAGARGRLRADRPPRRPRGLDPLPQLGAGPGGDRPSGRRAGRGGAGGGRGAGTARRSPPPPATASTGRSTRPACWTRTPAPSSGAPTTASCG